MKVAHQNIQIGLALAIFLSACTPLVTATAQPTSTPQPTITPTVITIDQNVEAFLSGKFDDVSNLSLEERKEFSILLAQKINEARGARPLIYNNEAYVDPITGMMKDYDGHPDFEETIQMYLAVTIDEEGNLRVKNEQGIWKKIEGSKGIDWNMVVTDPNDERVDWPTGGKKGSTGFFQPAANIDFGAQLMPMVILDTRVDQLHLTGDTPGIIPTITLLDIITDVNGIPMLARKVIVHATGQFTLYKEGSDYRVWQNTLDSLRYGFDEAKTQDFFANLKPNQAYDIVFGPDQSRVYEVAKVNPPDDYYENIVPVENTVPVLMGQQSDNINATILAIQSLIEIKD